MVWGLRLGSRRLPEQWPRLFVCLRSFSVVCETWIHNRTPSTGKVLYCGHWSAHSIERWYWGSEEKQGIRYGPLLTIKHEFHNHEGKRAAHVSDKNLTGIKVSTSNMHLPFWLTSPNSELGVCVIPYNDAPRYEMTFEKINWNKFVKLTQIFKGASLCNNHIINSVACCTINGSKLDELGQNLHIRTK